MNSKTSKLNLMSIFEKTNASGMGHYITYTIMMIAFSVFAFTSLSEIQRLITKNTELGNAIDTAITFKHVGINIHDTVIDTKYVFIPKVIMNTDTITELDTIHIRKLDTIAYYAFTVRDNIIGYKSDTTSLYYKFIFIKDMTRVLDTGGLASRIKSRLKISENSVSDSGGFLLSSEIYFGDSRGFSDSNEFKVIMKEKIEQNNAMSIIQNYLRDYSPINNSGIIDSIKNIASIVKVSEKTIKRDKEILNRMDSVYNVCSQKQKNGDVTRIVQ